MPNFSALIYFGDINVTKSNSSALLPLYGLHKKILPLQINTAFKITTILICHKMLLLIIISHKRVSFKITITEVHGRKLGLFRIFNKGRKRNLILWI